MSLKHLEILMPYTKRLTTVLKVEQTNVFICNYSHYIAGSLLDRRLPVI